MAKKVITITENEIKRIVAECVAKLQESGETPSDGIVNRNDTRQNPRKTVRVTKHPYMWEVSVEFGTLQEMLDNANDITGGEIEIGGSFNKRMWSESGRRAALITIGMKVYPTPDRYRFPKADEIKEAEGICSSPWEGVYWRISDFDEELKQGLYPVSANWDGKTYIQRWKTKGRDKNGVPIPGRPYYELTDTYRY